ncbi:MAG: hypothetical protein Q7R87_02310 [Nanoarchaeota archaeon]|nr:hypothetical protein [Nanoarchaeota archaeon]
MKGYLFLLCFLFLINVVYALEVGVSPPEIIFSDSEEESCQEIKIMSEDKRLFNVEDRWNTISNSRSPVFYTSTSKGAGVVLRYDKQVIVIEEEKFEVCLKSLEGGKKQGILIFESNGASLGVRIEVKSQVNSEKLGLGSITGGVIREDEGNDGKFKIKGVVLFLVLFDFLLFVVLLVLLFYLHRRKA